MDIKSVLTTLKLELDGAGTTHLSNTTVYLQDREAWNPTHAQKRAIFLIWAGTTGEEHHATGGGESASDIHTITVDIRVPVNDPTAAVRDPDDWYNHFLELYEEVKAELALTDTRRASDGSQKFNKLIIGPTEAGYVGEGNDRYRAAGISIQIWVPQV